MQGIFNVAANDVENEIEHAYISLHVGRYTLLLG